MVCTSSAEPVKLVFDEAGAYLMKTQRIAYTEVPAEVSTSVTSNYATYQIRKRASLITLTDGTLQYKVYLFLDGTHKSVTFNADGTVSCEK